MVRKLAIIISFALLTSVVAAQPYIGDYDLELRKDGRVDTDRMIQRLQELGANTYMYLIWHRATDWEDLREFLPAAREAGITVWVYLVPPSETPAVHPERGFPYSEPFRLDYVRWAEEIAKLSLEHDNLVGWVMDDFWGNVQSGFFTEKYVREFQAAAKGINPALKFYVLLYPTWGQIGAEFAQRFGPIVDGVVAAYPRDEQAIIDVQPYLTDTYHEPARLQVKYPGRTTSMAGHSAFAKADVLVTDGWDARLRFNYRDNFDGPTAGYHFMQVRVNGRVVWEQDVAGANDGEASINLTRHVRGERQVEIAMGVVDRQAVTHFPITATFSDLDADGLRLREFGSPGAWLTETEGEFTVEKRPALDGQGAFDLPLIVMPAAHPGEYEQRWDREATPERIAEKVRVGMHLIRGGHAQGVVTYCLDKSADSEYFDAVKGVFAEFQ